LFVGLESAINLKKRNSLQANFQIASKIYSN